MTLKQRLRDTIRHIEEGGGDLVDEEDVYDLAVVTKLLKSADKLVPDPDGGFLSAFEARDLLELFATLAKLGGENPCPGDEVAFKDLEAVSANILGPLEATWRVRRRLAAA